MKKFRREMPAAVKQKKDDAIRRGIQALGQYQACETLLTFVSTPIEVDTHALIEEALRSGKTVAVPYCIDGTRQMDFYCIRSMDDLVPRTFGVLEPLIDRCPKLADTKTAFVLCPVSRLTGTVFGSDTEKDTMTVFYPDIPALKLELYMKSVCASVCRMAITMWRSICW